MSSTQPNNWKRPWTDDNERPPITLPEPTRSIYTRDRQSSEPSTQDIHVGRRDSIPSLKRSSPSLQHVDPEDRRLHAMPKSSSADAYTNYLLLQDSPHNSTKRMRMSSNPWLDLKGKGLERHELQRETPRQEMSPGTRQDHTAATPGWMPMPLAAARPRDISILYNVGNTMNTEHCDACDKAAHIAPNIAKGLQRLHKDLKYVAARGQDREEKTPDLEIAEQSVPETLLGALDFSMDKLNDNIKVVKDMLLAMNLEDDRTPILRTDRAASREPLSHGIHSRSSPARQLPNPNTFNISNASLPGLSTQGSSLSPTTAHLHDLQHQLSTKVLAHQVLHAEHEKLLATHSRIQAKYTSLEKKQFAIDSELANSIEDRACLQVQVESLEQQVTELQTSRDEAQKQSVANGSQYMQIMAMSSRLQAQSAADLKKYKVDRETWSAEKEELEVKVKLLEKAQGTASIFAATLVASDKSAEEQNAADEVELAAMSFDKLKEEIMTLRRNVREASSVILTMRDEGAAITKLTSDLGAASERLIRLGVVPSISTAGSKV